MTEIPKGLEVQYLQIYPTLKMLMIGLILFLTSDAKTRRSAQEDPMGSGKQLPILFHDAERSSFIHARVFKERWNRDSLLVL